MGIMHAIEIKLNFTVIRNLFVYVSLDQVAKANDA